MLRSALAVLAGIAVLTVTSFAIEAATDPLLLRLFPFALPDRNAISHNLPASLFMAAYTTLCIVAGGYVTARLARRSPLQHAVVMGVVQTALTLWAMVAIAEQTPLRNWLITLVLTVPAAWCGAMLYARRTFRSDSALGNPR